MRLRPREMFEQGVLYYKNGKYVKARECWELAAENGIASAMFCLGIISVQNDENYDKAIYWFKKAHDAGHRNAYIQLENILKENIESIMPKQLFDDNDIADEISNQVIEFGGYEWYVMKKSGDLSLCLSRYIIDIRQYHPTDINVTWENSEIRRWLNCDFYNSLNERDRRQIVSVNNENYANPCYGTNAGEITNDFIFLLSYQEVIDCFNCKPPDASCDDLLSQKLNNQSLIAIVNMSEKKINEATSRFGLDYEMAQNKAIGWWLRTPGETGNKAVRVNCNGAIRLHGRDVDRCLVGVRPAVWIRKID